MNWQKHWKILLKTFLFSICLLVGLIWLVDPYGNIVFSPNFERTAMATNQRYSYPFLARKKEYDSAIFGTSTSRLLKPETMNQKFTANFVNLAMNSATDYEQSRIFEVFLRNHPTPKFFFLGMDNTWCVEGVTPDKYTFRRFPEWMYDDNPWNDLSELLEFKTFETLGKQAAFLLGLKPAKYNFDGYANFLPPIEEYDLEKVRQSLYPKRAEENLVVVTQDEQDHWVYPPLRYFEKMLKDLPLETRKIISFVPYHFNSQPKEGTLNAAKLQECKKRVSRIAQNSNNITVIDFMVHSPITLKDEHYWDPLHFSVETADVVMGLLEEANKGITAKKGEYQILLP